MLAERTLLQPKYQIHRRNRIEKLILHPLKLARLDLYCTTQYEQGQTLISGRRRRLFSSLIWMKTNELHNMRVKDKEKHSPWQVVLFLSRGWGSWQYFLIMSEKWAEKCWGRAHSWKNLILFPCFSGEAQSRHACLCTSELVFSETVHEIFHCEKEL